MLNYFKTMFLKHWWESQSYGLDFLIRGLRIIFHLFIFYFFLNSLEPYFHLSLSESQKTGIITYVALGIIFFQILIPVLTAPAQIIRHEQLLGNVELLFSTTHHPNQIFLGLSLPKIISSLLQVFFSYFLFALLAHQTLPQLNLLPLTLFTIFATLGFLPLGWLLASLTLLYHKSEIHDFIGGSIIMVLSGVYFDTNRLPFYLDRLATLLPFKQALDLLRHFSGWEGQEIPTVLVNQKLAYLTGFFILIWLSAFWFNQKLVRTAKRWGTLKSY